MNRVNCALVVVQSKDRSRTSCARDTTIKGRVDGQSPPDAVGSQRASAPLFRTKGQPASGAAVGFNNVANASQAEQEVAYFTRC
jgi:hypothetical protein